MKRIITYGILLIGFLIISCDLELKPGGSNKFTQDLQGTWVTSNQSDRYTGTLVIGTNHITITGFDEYQTPWLGNDNERPFRGLNIGYALSGYSEVGEAKGTGKIFIQYKGEWLEGISYFYESNSSAQVNLLYFTFSGRDQVMVRQK